MLNSYDNKNLLLDRRENQAAITCTWLFGVTAVGQELGSQHGVDWLCETPAQQAKQRGLGNRTACETRRRNLQENRL